MSLQSLVQELVELPESVLAQYVSARSSEACPPEALIILIAALRDACDDLGALKKRIGEDIGSEYAPTKTVFQVPEIGPVEVGHKQVRTQWDKDRLLARLVSFIVEKPGILCDAETGETHPPAVIAHLVYLQLKNAVSFGAPKLPFLRDAGLDPSEWSQSRWETQVSLPKRAL